MPVETLVVIPAFNKEEMTMRCVESCYENAGIDHDILVVDDGSYVPFKEFENANLLRIDQNSGFTNTVNQGILWASDIYKYILLLNNDTVPYENFLKYLVDAMEQDDEIGISGSVRIHFQDGAIKYIENYALDLTRGNQLISSSNLPSEVIPTDWIAGCSILLRHSMVREIGLLDKQFRNHCSDTDYCLRANMAGWKVALITKSRVLHHLSQTVKENKISPKEDQNKFVAKLAGLKYAELMARMPLDCEEKTYGRIEFDTYTK